MSGRLGESLHLRFAPSPSHLVFLSISFAIAPLSLCVVSSAKMSNYYCQNEFGKGFDAKDKFKF